MILQDSQHTTTRVQNSNFGTDVCGVCVCVCTCMCLCACVYAVCVCVPEFTEEQNFKGLMASQSLTW